MSLFVMKATLGEDKTLLLTAPQVFVQGESDCCAFTVTVPEAWRNYDYIIAFECPHGRAFASPVLKASGTVPSFTYTIGNVILFSEGRVNLQIIAKYQGIMVLKSIIDGESGFDVLRGIENIVDAYTANDILSSISQGLIDLNELCRETRTVCEETLEVHRQTEAYIAELRARIESGEFSGKNGANGAKGDKGDKGEKGENGDSIKVLAWYASVAAMNLNISYHNEGDIVGILHSEGSADSGKIYVKKSGAFQYVATFGGIKGEKGDTGAKGEKGDTGATPSISVSSVTLPAGSLATATKTGTDLYPIISFGLPRGDKGEKGDTGNTGAKGDKGDAGIIPSLTVSATTLTAGADATAAISGSTNSPHISFGLPRGTKGDTGSTGAAGATPQITVSANTLSPNYSAYCIAGGTTLNPHFTFGIPRGYNGEDAVFPSPMLVTIKTNQWSSNSYTLTNVVVEDAGKLHLSLPIPTTRVNADAINAASIIITAVTLNSVTFSAKTVPTADIALALRNVASL